MPVTLVQDQLDGLCALIHYCEGVAKSGQGRVPGSFELVMHYRELRSRVHSSQNKVDMAKRDQ